MSQYILSHDGDYWIITTGGPITVADLINDAQVVMVCICYYWDLFSHKWENRIADDDHFRMIKEKLIEELGSEPGIVAAETFTDLPIDLRIAFLIKNIICGEGKYEFGPILHVYDPTKVGLGNDEQEITECIVHELKEYNVDELLKRLYSGMINS